MAERPILFSAPMVRALLAGTKTQTRRIVKGVGGVDAILASEQYPDEFVAWMGAEPQHSTVCPYGVPGDHLWVRETHYLTDDGESEYAVYAADERSAEKHLRECREMAARHPVGDGWLKRHTKLRPSIHMLRWASRITLTITDVRVERLNEISHRDACAEGLISKPHHWHDPEGPLNDVGYLAWEGAPDIYSDAADAYRALWEHINGAGSWDANPWVWAVTFERVV